MTASNDHYQPSFIPRYHHQRGVWPSDPELSSSPESLDVSCCRQAFMILPLFRPVHAWKAFHRNSVRNDSITTIIRPINTSSFTASLSSLPMNTTWGNSGSL